MIMSMMLGCLYVCCMGFEKRLYAVLSVKSSQIKFCNHLAEEERRADCLPAVLWLFVFLPCCELVYSE